jgi:hypothetical protein
VITDAGNIGGCKSAFFNIRVFYLFIVIFVFFVLFINHFSRAFTGSGFKEAHSEAGARCWEYESQATRRFLAKVAMGHRAGSIME